MAASERDVGDLLIEAVTGRPLPPTVLLGAGASTPQLPVAFALQTELLRIVAGIVEDDPHRIDALVGRMAAPHLSLEVFFSMLRYRCGDAFRPVELWRSLCDITRPNALSMSLGRARQAGRVGPLLTTNFDFLLPRALNELGAEEGRDFRVITEWQLTDDGIEVPAEQDIFALHGTVYRSTGRRYAPPVSATARGLVTPFRQEAQRYLSTLFRSDRQVIVAGYSGQDHYDVNLLLNELRRSHPDALRNWIWLAHTDDRHERDRVESRIGPGHVVVADATTAFADLCTHLGLPGAHGADLSVTADPDRWRETLAGAVESFALPPDGVQRFVEDLQRNLPGAWVALEHYRIFSAGYDETAALTFGGIDTAGDEAASMDLGHLSYLEAPWEVQYGQLLEAQFRYWSEDSRHTGRDRGPNGDRGDDLYPRSSAILLDVLDRIREVLARAPAELRAEDRALLLIGCAVADDYLGLIERKRGLLVPAEREPRWTAARRHFQACRDQAIEAGRSIQEIRDDATADGPTASSAGTTFADDLIPHRLWASIGQANLARTVEDRAAATAAFVDVLDLMQDMVDHEAERAAANRDSGVFDEYLTALYPQQWLRASELLKEVLGCRGNVATPRSWDELDEAERDLARRAVTICEDAYTSYAERASLVNSRYPARYEALMVLHAARAIAPASVDDGERAEARERMRDLATEFTRLAERHPDIRPNWVRNVHDRIERLEDLVRAAEER